MTTQESEEEASLMSFIWKNEGYTGRCLSDAPLRTGSNSLLQRDFSVESVFPERQEKHPAWSLQTAVLCAFVKGHWLARGFSYVSWPPVGWLMSPLCACPSGQEAKQETEEEPEALIPVRL